MSNRRGNLDKLLAVNDEKQSNEIARRTKLLYTPLDLPSYHERAMNDKRNVTTSLLEHKSKMAADTNIASHHGKKKSSQSSKPPSLQPMRQNKHPLKLREKSIQEKIHNNSKNSSYATINYSKEKTKDACSVIKTSYPVISNLNQPLYTTIESATKNSTVNIEPMYKVLAVSSSSCSNNKIQVQEQNKTSQPSATLLNRQKQCGLFTSFESGKSTVVALATSNSLHADNSNIIGGPALTDSTTAKSAQMIVQVEPREQVKAVLLSRQQADNDDDRNRNEITAPRMMLKNSPMSMALTSTTAFPTSVSKLHNNVNSLDESEKKMTFTDGDSQIINQQPSQQSSTMMSIEKYNMITNNVKKKVQPTTLLNRLSSSSCPAARTVPNAQKLVEEGSLEYNLQSLTNELSDIRRLFELIQSKTI